MIALIATIQIKEGVATEFERVFLELAAGVRDNEPGILTYQLCRSRDDVLTYRVLEIYRDQEALELHLVGELVGRMRASFEALLDGDPGVEYLDALS